VDEYSDRILRCIDCGGEFTFTAGEQQFFADKGLKNEPKRCKPCKKRKNERIAATRPSQRVEVIVTCALCGVETSVPFRPTQGRPVLCRACFLKSRVAATEAQTPV
jgi:CxxC-x17-CxxC domain-containing protein